MLQPATIIATGCTTAVGAFVQGITSFGYAVVSWTAYSILTQLHVDMPDYHSFLVCLACFACSTVSILNLVRVCGRIPANLPAIAIAMALEFPGNYAGVWFSHVVPVAILHIIIGGAFVAMSLPRISMELLALAEGGDGARSTPEVPSKKQMREVASVIGKDSRLPCSIGSGSAAEDGCAAASAVEAASTELASPESSFHAALGEDEAARGCGALISGGCRMPASNCGSSARLALGLALTGALSGFCHGSVAIPGPPWMLFFAFVGIDKSDGRAIFAFFELMGGLNFLATYASSGQLQRQHAPLYVVVVLTCAVGVSLGNCVHPHVSPSGAALSLLVLTLLAGLQALGAFDLADRTGGVCRLLLLAWAASLLGCAACRRRCRGRAGERAGGLPCTQQEAEGS